MIVREVLTSPELMENFDHFNDYKDTMNWLAGVQDEFKATAQKCMKTLTERYNSWHANHIAQTKWSIAVKKYGYFARRFVASRILRDGHGLEELGSSDINCRAIDWIRCGLLIVDDGPPRWTDEG